MPNYIDNIDVIDANNDPTNILLQDRGTLAIANTLVQHDVFPVFTKDANNEHGYVEKNLTAGDLNRDKYESLITASGAIGTIDGQSPDGNIGIFGASSTSDIPTSTEQYPIGVMGLAVADNENNPSTIGAGYFHLIREESTEGASIGLEIDCDVEEESQDITPNTLPDPLQNYSSALQLSSGGGTHTLGDPKDLSTAIAINANPGKFKHGLVITNDSVTEEAISLPNNARIAWWNNPNNIGTDGNRPAVYMTAADENGYGQLVIGMYNRTNQDYEQFLINRFSLMPDGFGLIEIASDTYTVGSHTITIPTSLLPANYHIKAVLNLQPYDPSGNMIINNWTNSTITFYCQNAVTTALMPVCVFEHD